MGLSELAPVIIAGALAVVGVDTGLVHLAAALDVPCITMYGATDQCLTGNMGHKQRQMTVDFPCAPCLEKQCRLSGTFAVHPACYETLNPGKRWSQLDRMISAR